jgi:hypothetical protein
MENLLGRTIAQVVSRRDLTAGAQVCTRDTPCGQRGAGTGFSLSSSNFSLPI